MFICRNSRRAFLTGMSAGAAALVAPFMRREASAQAGRPGPLRFMLLTTPDGRPAPMWKPSGSETSFTLGPTMKPFERHRADLVVIDGLDHARSNEGRVDVGGAEAHSGALTSWMTGMVGSIGAATAVGGGKPTLGRAPSADQLIAANAAFVGDTRLGSLQVAGDTSLGGPNDPFTHANLSWAGPNLPLLPEYRPLQNYQRIFDKLVPSADGAAALARVVAEQRSVLDLLKRDWQRMSAVLPAAQKPSFEAHLEAFRRVERELGTTAPAATATSCRAPQSTATAGTSRDDFPSYWKLNAEIVRLAFACDITRVVTFMSSPSTSYVSHGWAPGKSSSHYHHALSHNFFKASNPAGDIAAINLWYSEMIAALVTSFKETPDGAGSLLDHMLLLYGSEFGDGSTHNPTNVPFVLFGKAGGRLRTGRYLSFLSNRRCSNDLWVSVLQMMLGTAVTTFGDPMKCRGPLPGLM